MKIGTDGINALGESKAWAEIVGVILTGFIGQTLLHSVDLDESFNKLPASS